MKKETILQSETRLFNARWNPKNRANLSPLFKIELIKVEHELLGTYYYVKANNFDTRHWLDKGKLYINSYKSKAWALKKYRLLNEYDLEVI